MKQHATPPDTVPELALDYFLYASGIVWWGINMRGAGQAVPRFVRLMSDAQRRDWAIDIGLGM